jgi:hypothetical protein
MTSVTPEERKEWRRIAALADTAPSPLVVRDLLDALDAAEHERDKLQAQRGAALALCEEAESIYDGPAFPHVRSLTIRRALGDRP